MHLHEQHHAAPSIMSMCSFYPLYPPAPGVMLDTTRAAQLAMHSRPDILLLPSDLAPWLKVTPASCSVLPPTSASMDKQDTAVLSINPGRAVKGSSGGTHALVEVRPANSESGPSTPAAMGQGIAAQARAEVRRL